MNCTIWRNTSTSAPFSASSANAIVEAVIVILLTRLVGRTSTISGSFTMATPPGLPALKTYTTSWDITLSANHIAETSQMSSFDEEHKRRRYSGPFGEANQAWDLYWRDRPPPAFAGFRKFMVYAVGLLLCFAAASKHFAESPIVWVLWGAGGAAVGAAVGFVAAYLIRIAARIFVYAVIIALLLGFLSLFRG